MDMGTHQVPGDQGSSPEPESHIFAASPPNILSNVPQDPLDEDFVPTEDELESSENDLDVPLKRAAEDDVALRPFKRQKGLLTVEYLNLLNKDIQDAAERITLGVEDSFPPPSQLGLTSWSSIEKSILFESVARLGRGELQVISERIGSKSVVEVNQYLQLLEDQLAKRQAAGAGPVLSMADYPAAVELSQQCCHALEEAADTISLKQESREIQREEGKWGDIWDLTPLVSKRLQDTSDKSTSPDLRSVKILSLPNWLKLSRRLFMNSSVPGDNWAHVGNTVPSIWATAFEDFHSLTISVTRRLVQAALYAAMTRIKSRQERRQTSNIIRRMDVKAAVASLGMPVNANEFWCRSARRLRLDVYQDIDENGEPVVMSYDDVEDELSAESISRPSPGADRVDRDEVEYLSDEPNSDEEQAAIDAEAEEVFRFSVADFPEIYRMRQALKSRIATERQQEAFADERDQHASYEEELRMWDILQRPPPREIPRKADPGPPQRSRRDVETMYPLGKDWRKNTRYKSEWESWT